LPATRKYEQEGGPTLAAVIELLRGTVRLPIVHVQAMIEWQAFNVVAGNSDGHAKNLSILHGENGPTLAPFYDLLATRQYERLDRHLAMGVGGIRDPDQIARAHWETLAGTLGIAPRVTVELVRGVADRCLEAVPLWTKAFRELYGDEPVLQTLQTLPRAVTRRAKRALRLVA
jgi:serine/threonine-protein kinase HipA